MISRRQVLVGGGGGLAAAGLGPAAPPARGREMGGRAHALALFLYDGAIPGADAAARVAAGAGVPAAAFGGDIGVPWLELVAPLWRAAPVPVAGITDGGALFCLEQLARGHGLCCTVRLALPVAGAARIEAAARALLGAAEGAPLRRDSAGPANLPVAWLLQPIARNVR
ncbi:hypothetical protein ACFQ1E_19670 [Sphingomonas canadensis]|uniref:Tat pathway signal protein n=1 Tax=Sphingomonas canadensis TaxID=1219257 RepID=A0ABW3HBL0_9SPHN|nr:hypothetical protein [Sphingomonas canadensis]MCW3838244.1 hypothetical protein [Sphingomonas canadensis]